MMYAEQRLLYDFFSDPRSEFFTWKGDEGDLRTANTQPLPPTVIDADDLPANPSLVLQKYCSAIGIGEVRHFEQLNGTITFRGYVILAVAPSIYESTRSFHLVCKCWYTTSYPLNRLVESLPLLSVTPQCLGCAAFDERQSESPSSKLTVQVFPRANTHIATPPRVLSGPPVNVVSIC